MEKYGFQYTEEQPYPPGSNNFFVCSKFILTGWYDISKWVVGFWADREAESYTFHFGPVWVELEMLHPGPRELMTMYRGFLFGKRYKKWLGHIPTEDRMTNPIEKQIW